MQSFKWSKAHEIFLPQLDAEHRNLFRMADELQKAILANADTVRVLELLRAFINGAEDHFLHEERMMRSGSYPSYTWHKRQHDTVRKKTKGLLAEIESGEPEASKALLVYLSGWLKDHTALTDRMMGAYLRNQERLRASAS